MRAVLLGAGGQLGHDFQQALDNWDLLAFDRQALDLCDHAAMRERLVDVHPEVVINAAAYTAVDDCEFQVEEAFRVNAFAVRNLAQICRDIGSMLVHFSTDYVFDGGKGSPYDENDLPRPLNVYGTSKLAGEHFVRSTLRQHILIRTSGLYGAPGRGSGGGNFVETMLALAQERDRIQVVEDQILSPTYTCDLIPAVITLVEKEAFGLFHLTNRGSCSWFEFAQAIFQRSGLNPDVAAISSDELARDAPRPGYSVLDNGKWVSLSGKSLPPWEDALTRYLQARKGPAG